MTENKTGDKTEGNEGSGDGSPNEDEPPKVDTRPQRGRRGSKAAKHSNALKAAADNLNKDAKADLPNDPDKLKDMIITLKKRTDDLTGQLSESALREKQLTAKANRVDSAESALRSAAVDSGSKFRPIIGYHLPGADDEFDHVVMGAPTRPGSTNKFADALLMTAKIVPGEDKDHYVPVGPVSKIEGVKLVDAAEGAYYTLK